MKKKRPPPVSEEDTALFREAMTKIGLETPQSQLITNVEKGLAFGAQIGYPLMIKARSGGGGRGITRPAHQHRS